MCGCMLFAGGYTAPWFSAVGGGLSGLLASWPGGMPSSEAAAAGGLDTSLYSQLAAAQRRGRPPRPGAGGTNSLSAPADLQQELRVFVMGQPLSKPLGQPLDQPTGGQSMGQAMGNPGRGFPFGGSEPGLEAMLAERQRPAPLHRAGRAGSMPSPGSAYGAPYGGGPSYSGASYGASPYNPGVPSTAANITEFAASLIGFDGRLPGQQGCHPAAAGGFDAGLGLGGSGLATHSVPLLPSLGGGGGSLHAGGGGFGRAVGPFQVLAPETCISVFRGRRDFYRDAQMLMTSRSGYSGDDEEPIDCEHLCTTLSLISIARSSCYRRGNSALV